MCVCVCNERRPVSRSAGPCGDAGEAASVKSGARASHSAALCSGCGREKPKGGGRRLQCG